jgi:hypothetical protein
LSKGCVFVAGDAGVVESPRLLGAGAREADGTAIGVRRRLAVEARRELDAQIFEDAETQDGIPTFTGG